MNVQHSVVCSGTVEKYYRMCCVSQLKCVSMRFRCDLGFVLFGCWFLIVVLVSAILVLMFSPALLRFSLLVLIVSLGSP